MDYIEIYKNSGLIKGQIQLSVRAVNEASVSIHVVKASTLTSSLPLANSFVTAGLIPIPDGAVVKNPQTSTVVCSNNPCYNEVMTLDISKRGSRSRLFVAVWNKLPERKPAELIGAMSFSLKHCLTEPFSGWYHLLEECLATSKHLRAESPVDPYLLQPRASDDQLYQNTSEQHYKQPRKLPLSTATSTLSRDNCRVRRSSSSRKPAPRHRPPPVPTTGPTTTCSSSVSSSDNMSASQQYYNTHSLRHTARRDVIPPDTHYKRPRKSLYKRPRHVEGSAQPIKHRSNENLYANIKELARFDQPVSLSTSSQNLSSCSSSRASSLDRLSSTQESSSINNTLDRLSSNRGSQQILYQDPVVTRPSVSKQASIRRVRRQSELPISAMMSPDSSQSSSDSQAAWQRLTGAGQKYTPYVLTVTRGSSGFGFSLSEQTPVGICHIDVDSSAERAGLRVGDRIIEVQGEELSNADMKHVAAIIRHQQKSMKMMIWRPTIGRSRSLRQSKLNLALASNSVTPTKRSASARVSGSLVARKKHKQHTQALSGGVAGGGGKEKKGRIGRRSEREADGASICEQPVRGVCKKALDMVSYLYEEEMEFCDVMRRSYRYHANELQLTGKVDEDDTFTLFQNMDMLISMSQYFSAKLEIVVRQATDGKKMIATAPEIYSPRIEVLRQNYIKYLDGIKDAEHLKMVLKTERDVHTPLMKEVLSLEEFLHNPLHHIQKISAAFTVLLQNIEKHDQNLPLAQRICAELQSCCEKIEACTRINRSLCESPISQSLAAKPDLEMVMIQDRLEFPPHVPRIDLCQDNRHKLYWSDVKIPGIRQKMVAYLFSDIILVARQQGGRENRLLVAMDPVNLCDVIDVEYGSNTNDCELTLHYLVAEDQSCELSMICTDVETKLVWKGLLRDRLSLNRAADHSLSDQGIQVSESSECTDGEELCCDPVDSSPPTTVGSTPPQISTSKPYISSTAVAVGRSPDGLSDSMTAVADDLCPPNQLRNNSSGTSAETASDCLQLADYTKHEAKQAMTVTVNNNNNNNNNCPPISDEDLFTAGLPTFTVGPPSPSKDIEAGGERRLNAFGMMRASPIDLSAITEEGDDLTNTSMHISTCSHEDTPSTPSDCTSTPLDKSASSYSKRSGSSLPLSSKFTDSDPELARCNMSRGDKSYLAAAINRSQHRRSYSNPELYSEDLTSNSQSLSGYGEEMCTTPTTTTSNTNNSSSQLSSSISAERRRSISADNGLNLTFESQRCELPGQRSQTSFTLGDDQASTESTPTSLRTPASPGLPVFYMPHVESDAKLSSRSPAQKKSLTSRIRRSKSYTTGPMSSHTIGTPNHARFLQQQMNQLTFEQNSGKADGRQRKFSAVAKNVRNVLSFFKRRPSEVNTPLPSIDVVESWSHNFSNLLNDKYGLMLFRNFLCSEYSEENIEFWIACEEYKQLKTRQFAPRAQKIYSDYVTVHAPKEVNLDSKTRLETMKNLSAPDKLTFNLAQSRIQCLMEKDSYTRFLKSHFYTTVLTQARAPASDS